MNFDEAMDTINYLLKRIDWHGLNQPYVTGLIAEMIRTGDLDDENREELSYYAELSAEVEQLVKEKIEL